MSRRSKQRQTLYPYKSRLEVETQKLIPKSPYEQDKVPYLKEHTYNPDWTLRKNVYLEAKGRFTSVDRAKHLLIKKQHPEVTVYFLFEKPYQTLSKRSKTTYADWCDKNGFSWTTLEKGIPPSWLKGDKNEAKAHSRKA